MIEIKPDVIRGQEVWVIYHNDEPLAYFVTYEDAINMFQHILWEGVTK